MCLIYHAIPYLITHTSFIRSFHLVPDIYFNTRLLGKLQYDFSLSQAKHERHITGEILTPSHIEIIIPGNIYVNNYLSVRIFMRKHVF